MENAPFKARKAVERIMNGYIYRIDLEVCDLLTTMADMIEELENKLKKIEYSETCKKRGYKKGCQNSVSTKTTPLQKKGSASGLEKPD